MYPQANVVASVSSRPETNNGFSYPKEVPRDPDVHVQVKRLEELVGLYSRLTEELESRLSCLCRADPRCDNAVPGSPSPVLCPLAASLSDVASRIDAANCRIQAIFNAIQV